MAVSENSERQHQALLGMLEPLLAAKGLMRQGNLFLLAPPSALLVPAESSQMPACRATHAIQAIAIGSDYDARVIWLHATAKFPALIALLNGVRPFTYQKDRALTLPDYRSHLACMLRLDDLPALNHEILSHGMRQRADGRLGRARSTSLMAAAETVTQIVTHCLQPTMAQSFTLARVASVAEHVDFSTVGIAGAWSLAALLLLGNLEGAARAFACNPSILGADPVRREAAIAWLLAQGAPLLENVSQGMRVTPQEEMHACSWLGRQLLYSFDN